MRFFPRCIMSGVIVTPLIAELPNTIGLNQTQPNKLETNRGRENRPKCNRNHAHIVLPLRRERPAVDVHSTFIPASSNFLCKSRSRSWRNSDGSHCTRRLSYARTYCSRRTISGRMPAVRRAQKYARYRHWKIAAVAKTTTPMARMLNFQVFFMRRYL